MSIYLDNAATTRVAPEVLEAMLPYFSESYGNAGSIHHAGRKAAEAIDLARRQTASLFGTTPEHVIFTSGGSECNSMVFKGLKDLLLASGKKHVIISATEHDSVLKAAQSLTKYGFHITYVKPDSDGQVCPKAIEDAITPCTGLVSVMFVNNEVGSVNDVEGIGKILKKNSILFHTDCVQGAGQYHIDVDKMGADFATISAHKIHGPKGIGALYVRCPEKLSPLICGGAEQELGIRGGTENVAGIVGLGTASKITCDNLREDMIYVSSLKQRFYALLCDELKNLGGRSDCIHVNGLQPDQPGKILNLRIEDIDGETLLLMLDAKGIYVSAGSACRSHEAKPSHVLTAMGLSKEEARSSLRFSFSKYNTGEEMECAAQTIASCIFSLQKYSEVITDENMGNPGDMGNVR